MRLFFFFPGQAETSRAFPPRPIGAALWTTHRYDRVGLINILAGAIHVVQELATKPIANCAASQKIFWLPHSKEP